MAVPSDFEDRPTTVRLAESLVKMGVDDSYAADVALCQWRRLAHWLLERGEDGKLGSLTPRAFTHVLRFDKIKKADQLYDAWMESGFIENPNTSDAVLTDFFEVFRELLRKRGAEPAPNRRPMAAEPAPDCRPSGAHSPPRVRADSDSDSESHRDRDTKGVPPLHPEAPSTKAANDLADLWAEVCPTLPQPTRPLAPGIAKAVNDALKREKGRDWRATFTAVAASAWLTGATGESFRASLPWVIGPKNLAKLDGGAYPPAADANHVPPKISRLRANAAAAFAIVEQQKAAEAGFGLLGAAQ